MLRFLDCKHDYMSDSNTLVTYRNDDFQTTVKDIYAIGDCVQINGAQVAQLEGTLSGYNVADSLSYDIKSEFLEDKNICRSKLRKLKTFQVNLWKLYKSNDNNYYNNWGSGATLFTMLKKESIYLDEKPS